MKILIWVLFLHFVGDFIVQTDAQAKAKSKNWRALTDHVGNYTAFLMAGLILVNPRGAVLFAFVNGVVHFWTDAVTSRASSRLWAAGRTHAFFVVIGADQFIHAATLIFSLPLLGVVLR